MSGVELAGIAKAYGSRSVIEGLDLTIEPGSFTVLVGPSGCGKSSTLRMIAGLERPTAGRIRIGGRDITASAPGDRGVAMVFQNYAIYPTMTVEQNIEYGLKNTGVPKAQRRELVAEIAETVGLADHLGKQPGDLSGGERQRVALARAMVRKPEVFLMDEPLSNLDARLRQHMRGELVDLHERLGATFVYVTHDQVEAMSMGTRIVLMDGGRIMQEATPTTLYREPANVFSARFIGSPAMNLVSARSLPAAALAAGAPAGAAFAGFRPEHTVLTTPGTPIPPGQLAVFGTVLSSEYLGAETVDRVRLDTGEQVAVRTFDEAVPHHRGAIELRIPAARIVWFDEQERRLPGVTESTGATEPTRAARPTASGVGGTP